jgi:predicted peroxiredoxin
MKKQTKKETLSFRAEPEYAQLIAELAKQSGSKNLTEFIKQLIDHGLKFHQCELTQYIFETRKGQTGKFYNRSGEQYYVQLNSYGDMHEIYKATYEAYRLMAKKFGFEYAPDNIEGSSVSVPSDKATGEPNAATEPTYPEFTPPPKPEEKDEKKEEGK